MAHGLRSGPHGPRSQCSFLFFGAAVKVGILMRTPTIRSIVLVCASFAVSFSADPSKYVDRAAVEGLANKLSLRLHEFVCDQLRSGPLSSGRPCNTPGLKQLFDISDDLFSLSMVAKVIFGNHDRHRKRLLRIWLLIIANVLLNKLVHAIAFDLSHGIGSQLTSQVFTRNTEK